MQNEGFHAMFDKNPPKQMVDQIRLQTQWPESDRALMGEEAVSETISKVFDYIRKNGCVPRYSSLLSDQGALRPLHNEAGEAGQAIAGMAEADLPMSEDLYKQVITTLYGPNVTIPWCK